MARPKEDLPLEKVTLNLYAGDFDKLGEMFKTVGASKAIRTIIHAYIQRVEAQLAQAPQVKIDVELNE